METTNSCQLVYCQMLWETIENSEQNNVTYTTHNTQEKVIFLFPCYLNSCFQLPIALSNVYHATLLFYLLPISETSVKVLGMFKNGI